MQRKKFQKCGKILKIALKREFEIYKIFIYFTRKSKYASLINILKSKIFYFYLKINT
jgi:hypothetical protein